MRKDFSSITKMFVGTLGAQVVTLALMPVLTRLYSPEHFGFLGIFLSVANALLPIAAFTIPMAIVVAQSKKSAIVLSQIALVVSAAFAGVLLFIIYLFQTSINQQFSLPENSQLFYILPVFIFLTALSQVADNWAIRLNTFTLKSKTIFNSSILTNSSKLVLGLIFPSALMLVLTSIVMPINNFVSIFSRLRRRMEPMFSIGAFDIKVMQTTLVQYRTFPLFQAPQAFLNALSQGVPVIVLGIYFGPASAGFFTFAKLVLMTPVSLISKSVGDVLFGSLASKINQGEYQQAYKLLSRSTVILSLLGIPPLLILVFWSEPIFSFVFGQQWLGAGEFAKLLAFWTFLILLNPPSLKVIIALHKQKLSLLINLLTLSLRLIALYIGVFYTQDVIATVKYYALVSGGHNLIMISLAFILLNRASKKVS